MTSKFSNMVVTFLSSVSLEALSLLCSHGIILTTGFPSDFLVVPLQAHLQMLSSAWNPHLSHTTLTLGTSHTWLLIPHISA